MFKSSKAVVRVVSPHRAVTLKAEQEANDMSAKFDNCVKKGGKVRRKTLKGGKYINVCFLNGKSFAGEVHDAKKKEPEEKDTSWSSNL